jgi:hypothetical protein
VKVPKRNLGEDFKPTKFDDSYNEKVSDRINKDFCLKPGHNMKKRMCIMHKHTPVSYVCKYSEEFYCKHCISRHHNHGDLPLSYFQSEIQKELNKLKHYYFKKRLIFMDRVLKHKSEVEKYFEVYY